MSERITDIRHLDGLSIKDIHHMPHPADLARWSRDKLYHIDANVGVFRVDEAAWTGACPRCGYRDGIWLGRCPNCGYK